jgi:REP element-mobilizing transposase RayT
MAFWAVMLELPHSSKRSLSGPPVYQFVVVGYVVMPEHIHLLISEPQERTPSTVMQALKLGFARRALAQAKRQRNPAQASLFDHTPQHIW